MKSESLATNASNIGAFLLPGLALWLPSGYSWGAAWLLLSSVFFIRFWWRQPTDLRVKWLAGIFLLMMLVWGCSFDSLTSWGNKELALKYALATVCLLFVCANPPDHCWLWWGAVLGGIGAGGIALYQLQLPSFARAQGYTNAIQFGGIALYLAVLCGIGVLIHWCSTAWHQRVLALVAVFMALLASVLSDTRGSWLVFPIIFAFGAVLLYRLGQRKLVVIASAVLLIAVAALAGLQGKGIQERTQLAISEVDLYVNESVVDTSVGQRLAQWELALSMGMARPWTGWGEKGVVQEKLRRVQAHEADRSTLSYLHAHDEILDMFAKRGLIGVVALLLFYGIPMAVFWPTRKRCSDPSSGLIDNGLLSIRLAGVLLPICYAGFGLTQVFFAHNSGNMFYLFMLLLLMGTLIRQERDLQASTVGLPVSV